MCRFFVVFLKTLTQIKECNCYLDQTYAEHLGRSLREYQVLSCIALILAWPLQIKARQVTLGYNIYLSQTISLYIVL